MSIIKKSHISSDALKEAHAYSSDRDLRLAFVAGAKWAVGEIKSSLEFIREALPIEASISDPKLRSEIELVRNKINEIISKIQ